VVERNKIWIAFNQDINVLPSQKNCVVIDFFNVIHRLVCTPQQRSLHSAMPTNMLTEKPIEKKVAEVVSLAARNRSCHQGTKYKVLGNKILRCLR
jgi:hypothetical protein